MISTPAQQSSADDGPKLFLIEIGQLLRSIRSCSEDQVEGIVGSMLEILNATIDRNASETMYRFEQCAKFVMSTVFGLHRMRLLRSRKEFLHIYEGVTDDPTAPQRLLAELMVIFKDDSKSILSPIDMSSEFLRVMDGLVEHYERIYERTVELGNKMEAEHQCE